MAVSKWPQVKDKLLLIEKWARDGLSEAQMQKNLGISKSTFEEYKKRYSDFKNALKRGKEVFITEVENALSKRALGFEYEETKTYIKYEDCKLYNQSTQLLQSKNAQNCVLFRLEEALI